jgi:hypothetical protein
MWSAIVSLADLVERLTRRPRLRAHFDWVQHAGSPVLRFFFINSGRRRETIVEVRFGKPETPLGQGWMRQAAILDQLPVTLDPHSATLSFHLTTAGSDEFDVLLKNGQITKCFVETTGRRHHTEEFAVPPPP